MKALDPVAVLRSHQFCGLHTNAFLSAQSDWTLVSDVMRLSSFMDVFDITVVICDYR